MRPLVWLKAFLRTPGRRRLMGLEAGAELVRARLLTCLPSRIYQRSLGDLGQSEAPAPDPQLRLAIEIGATVATVATALPFRARCLQQVIATRRMLTRRGCPATIVLGVSREAGGELGAHAWLRVGGQIVSGDGPLHRFSVIGTFS